LLRVTEQAETGPLFPSSFPQITQPYDGSGHRPHSGKARCRLGNHSCHRNQASLLFTPPLRKPDVSPRQSSCQLCTQSHQSTGFLLRMECRAISGKQTQQLIKTHDSVRSDALLNGLPPCDSRREAAFDSTGLLMPP
jgi:hypothetical protein